MVNEIKRNHAPEDSSPGEPNIICNSSSFGSPKTIQQPISAALILFAFSLATLSLHKEFFPKSARNSINY